MLSRNPGLSCVRFPSAGPFRQALMLPMKLCKGLQQIFRLQFYIQCKQELQALLPLIFCIHLKTIKLLYLLLFLKRKRSGLPAIKTLWSAETFLSALLPISIHCTIDSLSKEDLCGFEPIC